MGAATYGEQSGGIEHLKSSEKMKKLDETDWLRGQLEKPDFKGQ